MLIQLLGQAVFWGVLVFCLMYQWSGLAISFVLAAVLSLFVSAALVCLCTPEIVKK